MLKRMLTIFTIAALVLSLAGCSGDTDHKDSKKKDKQTESSVEDTVRSEERDNKTGKTDSSTNSGKEDKADKENTASEASTEKSGNGKKNRNLVTKCYELESIDGHTRSEFQADPDLCSEYNAWEFVEYGTGIIVDFDYDSGSVQYTWQSVTQNAYSTASIDNPSGTMDILVFSFEEGESIGRSEVWDTVNVDYTDEVVTVTYSGGCVEVYQLQSTQ